MRIIIPGRMKDTMKGECSDCGCVFEATEKDAVNVKHASFRDPVKSYQFICPQEGCKARVWIFTEV